MKLKKYIRTDSMVSCIATLNIFNKYIIFFSTIKRRKKNGN